MSTSPCGRSADQRAREISRHLDLSTRMAPGTSIPSPRLSADEDSRTVYLSNQRAGPTVTSNDHQPSPWAIKAVAETTPVSSGAGCQGSRAE